MSEDALREGLNRMRSDGASEIALRIFEHHFRLAATGNTGIIDEGSIEPVDRIDNLDEIDISDEDASRALQKTVMIRLNGGLGTSMGLHGPKSLLKVRDGLSFLDIIARQVLYLRSSNDARLPLLFMDSFSTQEATLRALEQYPKLRDGHPQLGLDFLQHRQPKLLVDTLSPVSWPSDSELEWCPPGHGDIYPALMATGLLDQLLDLGITHAFVANADNLGATLDGRIAAWIQAQKIPFVMEVATRTANDRKGGHLARRKIDQRLILRESAQTKAEDVQSLQNIHVHRYMNTNNLWLDLCAFKRHIVEHGMLALPLILNRKTVDPTTPESPKVFQLESAMGAAIEVFEGARALHVPRSRFAPVKTTDDLLLVRSDVYELDDAYKLELVAKRKGQAPEIDLDRRYFAMLDDFELRFLAGIPSLISCDSLKVTGDVHFGANIRIQGHASIEAPDGNRLQIESDSIV